MTYYNIYQSKNYYIGISVESEKVQLTLLKANSSFVVRSIDITKANSERDDKFIYTSYEELLQEINKLEERSQDFVYANPEYAINILSQNQTSF